MTMTEIQLRLEENPIQVSIENVNIFCDIFWKEQDKNWDMDLQTKSKHSIGAA